MQHSFNCQVYIKVFVIITHRLLGRECQQVLQQSQHYVTHLKWPAISSAYPHTCFPVPHTHTHTYTCYAAHYHTVSQASPWQHHRHALSAGTRIKKPSLASRLAINASSKATYSQLDPLLPAGRLGMCVNG